MCSASSTPGYNNVGPSGLFICTSAREHVIVATLRRSERILKGFQSFEVSKMAKDTLISLRSFAVFVVKKNLSLLKIQTDPLILLKLRAIRYLFLVGDCFVNFGQLTPSCFQKLLNTPSKQSFSFGLKVFRIEKWERKKSGLASLHRKLSPQKSSKS